MDQAHQPDRDAAQRHGIDPQGAADLNCVGAEKVATDLLGWLSRALDHDRAVTGTRQRDRCRAARRPAADDNHRVPAHRRNGIYQATKACCSVMPAWFSNESHSARIKARAMEIWPSSRTNRCQSISLASSGNP